MDSSWTLHSPHGVLMESLWSLCGLHGLHEDSTQIHRFYGESMNFGWTMINFGEIYHEPPNANASQPMSYGTSNQSWETCFLIWSSKAPQEIGIIGLDLEHAVI